MWRRRRRRHGHSRQSCAGTIRASRPSASCGGLPERQRVRASPISSSLVPTRGRPGGAHVDSAGQAAWVRCGYCRALVGYDWQAWFESQEYAEWLRLYPAVAPGFTDFQKEVDAAREAARKGLLDEAERWLRQAVDRVM